MTRLVDRGIHLVLYRSAGLQALQYSLDIDKSQARRRWTLVLEKAGLDMLGMTLSVRACFEIRSLALEIARRRTGSCGCRAYSMMGRCRNWFRPLQ